MSMNPATFRLMVFNSPINSPSRNQPSWNGKEARKKFEEDATMAGYNDVLTYLRDLNKKDPGYLKNSALLYRECAAKHGDESTKCKFYKDYWLECKAAQRA